MIERQEYVLGFVICNTEWPNGLEANALASAAVPATQNLFRKYFKLAYCLFCGNYLIAVW